MQPAGLGFVLTAEADEGPIAIIRAGGFGYDGISIKVKTWNDLWRWSRIYFDLLSVILSEHPATGPENNQDQVDGGDQTAQDTKKNVSLGIHHLKSNQ